jgi:hypothetical protein
MPVAAGAGMFPAPIPYAPALQVHPFHAGIVLSRYNFLQDRFDAHKWSRWDIFVVKKTGLRVQGTGSKRSTVDSLQFSVVSLQGSAPQNLDPAITSQKDDSAVMSFRKLRCD